MGNSYLKVTIFFKLIRNLQLMMLYLKMTNEKFKLIK